MRWRELVEAPLADFDVFGDQQAAGSFRDDDLKAIRNPKWREKVFRAFEKTPFIFNVYLYNGPDGMVPVSRTGADIKTNDTVNLRLYSGYLSADRLQRLIGKTPPDVAQSITIVLVENEGAQRKPLTPWILAHRTVHSIFDDNTPENIKQIGSDILNIFSNYMTRIVRMLSSSPKYGQLFRNSVNNFEDITNVAKLIAKFRSGRTGTMTQAGEFVIEAVTQYLITGQVSFNRVEVDDQGRRQIDPAIDRELFALARANRRRSIRHNRPATTLSDHQSTQRA